MKFTDKSISVAGKKKKFWCEPVTFRTTSDADLLYAIDFYD